MKTKLYIILLLLFSLIACNNWLDITPKGQVEATDMLSTTSGYNTTLAGVYYTLSGNILYGKELSYGLMDLLAQYWDIGNSTNHKYAKLSQYDYTDAFAVSKIDSIWKNFYTGIAQCNLILESIRTNRNEIKNADLIEGEAYALRAFMHMELFRMFGPVIRTTADLEKTAIAYRTNFDVKALPFESGRSVLTKVKADLTEALRLLQNDPIIQNGRKGDANTTRLDYQDILNRRGARINYFAVLGLLARNEQLLLNNDEAYTYAKRLIDESKDAELFPLVNKSNIQLLGGKDLNYSKEMIFALYTNNLYDLADATFMLNGKGTSSTSFLINSDLYTRFLNELYLRTPDGSGNDNRVGDWFQGNPQTGQYTLLKLKKSENISGIGTLYDPEVPVIRMSEIYYIACESQIYKDKTLALSYLNEVRTARNLPKLNGPLTEDQLKEYLIRDARKDFIGEGRMFLMYKRLFAPIYVKAGLEIQPLETNFQFPIPEAEYEYSSNEKPKNN